MRLMSTATHLLNVFWPSFPLTHPSGEGREAEMPDQEIRTDPSIPIDLNVTCTTPHVLVYKLWYRQPGGQWVTIGQGSTTDNRPDHYQTGPHPVGTEVVYLFRIGGNAKTYYRAHLTIGQQGHLLADGLIVEEGWTDEDGLAGVQGRFTTS